MQPSNEPREWIASLSGSDVIRILEIIQGSIACKSESDFIALFDKIQDLFQFDFAGAMLGNHDDSRGLILAHGLNISFPEEWLTEYMSNNYFNADGATQETFRSCRLNHWSYLTTPEIKAIVPKEIISLNMDIGAREAYFHGSPPSSPADTVAHSASRAL